MSWSPHLPYILRYKTLDKSLKQQATFYDNKLEQKCLFIFIEKVRRQKLAT